MSFSDDTVRAKLSSLNETSESISTVSQWMLFHRRHAEMIAQTWMQRVKETASNKKLPLIYLANEIVQQSKIRKREEFAKAFDPIMVEATSAAYKASSSDVQNKIRRVIEVWRQRQVFSAPVQQGIESALDEIDRTRSGKKSGLGGSLFSSSSVPPELTPVAPLATTMQKADLTAKPALTAANQEYEKLTSASYAASVPSPPMHAHALNALIKKLATAEGAVAESIKARQSLLAGLEKLIETNKAKLSAEQDQMTTLSGRKDAIESKKRAVEEGILKGLTGAEARDISTAPIAVPGPRSTLRQDVVPPPRPDMEELTPPPMESFTPTGSPKPFVADDVLPEPAADPVQPHAVPATTDTQVSPPETAIGEMNSHGDITVTAQPTHAVPTENGAEIAYQPNYKKRKMSRSTAEDEFAAFAGDGDIAGIDANVGNLI